MTPLISSSPRLNRLLTFLYLDPGNLAIRKDVIRAACETGHMKIARELIEGALQTNIRDPELLASSGYVYLQDKRPVEAEHALRAVLLQGWDSSELHYNLAFALFMQSRYAEALEHLCLPVLSFELPPALSLSARCLYHLCQQHGPKGDCMAWFADAGDARASRLLALLRYGRTRPPAATDVADDSQQCSSWPAQDQSHWVVRESESARHHFMSGLQVNRCRSRARLGLALIALVRLDFESGRRHLEVAARAMPDDVDAWAALAWARVLLGDVAKAKAAFNRASAIDPASGESAGGLALVAALEGREDDARTGIRRAQYADPHSMSARYAQMLLLEREGRKNEAQAVLDAVLARPLPRSEPRPSGAGAI